jgi:hypothetical protein
MMMAVVMMLLDCKRATLQQVFIIIFSLLNSDDTLACGLPELTLAWPRTQSPVRRALCLAQVPERCKM